MSKFKILLGLVHRLLELESSLAAANVTIADGREKLIANAQALKESNVRAHQLANKPVDVSRTAQDAAAAHILCSLGYAWVEPTGWAQLKTAGIEQAEPSVSLDQEPDSLVSKDTDTVPGFTCKRCGNKGHLSHRCKTHDVLGKPLGAK